MLYSRSRPMYSLHHSNDMVEFSEIIFLKSFPQIIDKKFIHSKLEQPSFTKKDVAFLAK